MASKAPFLAFFLLFTLCLARQQQHHQLQQQQNQCQIQNIEAQEPVNVVRAEAGVTEFWDADNQLFQCAGVDFIRHRIQPGGLLLPSYVNTPILFFVEQGRGIQGVVLPGCPETYEYSPEQQQFSRQQDRRGQQPFSGQQDRQPFSRQQDRREQQPFSGQQDRQPFSRQQDRREQQPFSGQQDRRGQLSEDRHQKVENINEGDVVAIPPEPLTGFITMVIQNLWSSSSSTLKTFKTSLMNIIGDSSLPETLKLKANKARTDAKSNRIQKQSRGQDRRQEQPYQNAGNIFQAMDVEFIIQAFNVNREIAEKLQGKEDQRGHIVNAGQELQMIRPSQTRQQRQTGRDTGRSLAPRAGVGSNGIEETICSLNLKENIDNPTHADFVNPQAGIIANLNNFKFPILEQLQLSVERGYLHRNAIQSPHWTINAHNLLYVTEGTLRVQIVNNEGRSVFDDELREGQVVVIPQNFVVIKRAGEQGARWVSFKTNENARISNLAGRISAIRNMPVDVVATSFQLSRDEAQELKFNQQQAVLFTPNFSKGGERASA